MIEYLVEKYNLKNVRPLEGGYSFCDKYRTDDAVIKIFDVEHYDRVESRVAFMRKLHESGLKVPSVISYGKHNDKCYQIVEFIDGSSGESLADLPSETQYKIGVEAGKELRRFHSISEPFDNDVYGRTKEKVKRLVSKYKELDLKFEKEKVVLNYITSHLYLLKDRQARHLHGDFHPENMAFDENGYNGVYDFERDEYEDYVRDFERTLFFTRDYSLEYAKGFLEGSEFEEYEILKLYLAISIFASLNWSTVYYPKQYDEFIKCSLQVIDDFNDFKDERPKYMR